VAPARNTGAGDGDGPRQEAQGREQAEPDQHLPQAGQHPGRIRREPQQDQGDHGAGRTERDEMLHRIEQGGVGQSP